MFDTDSGVCVATEGRYIEQLFIFLKQNSKLAKDRLRLSTREVMIGNE